MFGGDETKENIEANLTRYMDEINKFEGSHSITVDGRIVPVSK